MPTTPALNVTLNVALIHDAVAEVSNVDRVAEALRSLVGASLDRGMQEQADREVKRRSANVLAVRRLHVPWIWRRGA